MIKIPTLPEKEELQYREKEFLLDLYELFRSTSKKLLILLLVVVILALPLKIVLKSFLANLFISSYDPPAVNDQLYKPQDLRVVRTEFLPVSSGKFSAYAQIINPNPNLSARELKYRLIFKDGNNVDLTSVSGEDYVLAGESKFFLVPLAEFDIPPLATNFVIDSVKWTAWLPDVEAEMDVLQQNVGLTPEGQFFVEGLVKNLQGFSVKKVQIDIIVFDSINQNPVAVNSTVVSDLKPFESRYFRAIWPRDFGNIGQVVVIPTVNPFVSGLILEPAEDIPVR